MRELDPHSPHDLPACAVVGAGRLGTVLAAALRRRARRCAAGEPHPAGRRRRAAVRARRPRSPRPPRAVPPGPLLGHCSGATGLEVLAGREGFSLHPLMSVPARQPARRPARRRRCASTAPRQRALATAARARRARSGMRPARVAPEDRVAYHAAAAMAANFLVALEACAERLAATAGIDPRAARAARPRHGARSGPQLGPEAGADRPDRPRRRGHRGPPPRGDRRAHARAAAAVRRARGGDPSRGGYDGLAHEDDPHHRRDARLPRPRPRARAAPSASCRRWAPSTPATTR